MKKQTKILLLTVLIIVGVSLVGILALLYMMARVWGGMLEHI
ncbi:MAG TPA: hypothetical protein VGC97_20015 [Pyrinomonadaceae bacterium]|jgi:hypothetical protein